MKLRVTSDFVLRRKLFGKGLPYAVLSRKDLDVVGGSESMPRNC